MDMLGSAQTQPKNHHSGCFSVIRPVSFQFPCIHLRSLLSLSKVTIMAVDIQIIGDPSEKDYQAAQELCDMFHARFPEDIEGRVFVHVNAMLFGQQSREVDLIVFGSFGKGLRLDLMNYKPCYISNFCFCIEIKDHSVGSLQVKGNNLYVKYKEGYKDASRQSYTAAHSVSNFFADCLGFKPFVCDFIWLRNVSRDNLKQLIGQNASLKEKHNLLPAEFSLLFLFNLACAQSKPNNPKGKDWFSFSCSRGLRYDSDTDFTPLFNLFSQNRENLGELTRQKLELITKKLLDKQNYAKEIGNKLVVVAGRAGTGKTVKILRIAYDLAANHGKRCLILSYNRALVSDIRRILALVKMPVDVDSQTVEIRTLYQFFLPFLEEFIVSDPTAKRSEIIPKFDQYMSELDEYITHGAVKKSDMEKVMLDKFESVSYDHILIDEAQDWRNSEKNILFQIFGPQSILIADGVDQMVRGREKCDWTRGVSFEKTNEKKSLRQKSNLVRFVNSYAEKCGLSWELDPKEELHGGRILITTKPYDFDLHEKELRKCEAAGNRAYEMLLLVPPSLVTKEFTSKGEKKRSYCSLIPSLSKSKDIQFWDGTATVGENQTEYPSHPNQHRIFQYESCRGLEGWTVVCVELDELIRSKMDSFQEEASAQLSVALFSLEEKRRQFVFLWSLIPLTRAIDTLVITIKDPKSETCKTLRSLAHDYQDFVDWIE